MTDMIVLCLFGGGTIFAALGAVLKKGSFLWILLAAVCVVCGVLSGLALGWTLDDLLAPVLAVCAAAMAALLLGRGGGEG